MGIPVMAPTRLLMQLRSARVTLVCKSLPLRRERPMVSRQWRPDGVPEEHLSWGPAVGSRGVSDLQQTSVQLLLVKRSSL